MREISIYAKEIALDKEERAKFEAALHEKKLESASSMGDVIGNLSKDQKERLKKASDIWHKKVMESRKSQSGKK